MNPMIEALLRGKETVIKTKEFLPTRQYVEPFLNQMSKYTDDFRVDVKIPDQITKINDEEDLTYNRVLIQAVLPAEHSIESHDEVVGFLYGLDVRKPVVKIYRGYLNQACTNLCVFDPTWINVQELAPGKLPDLNPITNLMQATSDFKVRLMNMKNTYVDRETKMNLLGNWVHEALMDDEDYGFGKVKLATSLPIKAYKEVFLNQDGDYYIPEGRDPSMFDIYNSFTQVLTDDKRDIMNKFEKTMLINRILKV